MTTELIKLEEDETILQTVRKHWFILFRQVAGIVVVGILPFILLIIFASSETVEEIFSQVHFAGSTVSFFLGAWLLIILITLFTIWTDYYLDLWIISNKRIISIDQQGFFRRSVSSFRFERLQDITVDIHGLIETLLDFGKIKADTAGHEPFIIKGIPNPRAIKALIFEHADTVIYAPMPKDFTPRPSTTPPRSEPMP
jgi:energy-coupling factor transporter transmembrane protein EcfT